MTSGSGRIWVAFWSAHAMESLASNARANLKVSLCIINFSKNGVCKAHLLPQQPHQSIICSPFPLNKTHATHLCPLFSTLQQRKGAMTKSTRSPTLWEKPTRDRRMAWSGTVPVLDLAGERSAAPLPVSSWFCGFFVLFCFVALFIYLFFGSSARSWH